MTDNRTPDPALAPTVTVGIEISSNAPQALLDRVTAMADDLIAAGVETTLDMIRACRVCGCTDDRACLGGCWWINDEDDLCSSCAPDEDASPRPRGSMGHVWPCPLFYTGNWTPAGNPQQPCTTPRACASPEPVGGDTRSDDHPAAGQPEQGEPS